MSQATLELVLQLKDEVSAGLEKTAGIVGNLGTLTAGLATGGVALLTGALVGAGVAGFSLASEASAGVNQLEAQLGLTEAQAAALGDTAMAVFRNNFGGSLTDVTEAVGTVRQQMQGLADQELQAVTEDALALRDVFGVEVAESTNAAAALMRDFGLTGQEATDFIAKGMQSGLNNSGDFLESITEYAPMFRSNKATAAEFFSAMETGAQGGMLGVDKVSDLFKEMSLRISDDSAVTREALASLGIPANDFFKGLRDGSLTGVEAFGLIQEGLRGTSDPLVAQAAGVALMGTQFEDLGIAAVLGIDTAKTSMEDMAAAGDSLNAKYNDLPSVIGGAWRMVQTDVLAPLGTDLLGLANDIMPTVKAGIAWVGAELPGWFATARGAISEVWTALQEGIAFAQSLLSPFETIINTMQLGRDMGLSWGEIFSRMGPQIMAALGSVRESLFSWITDSLPGWITGLQGFVQPAAQWVLDALPGLLDNLALFAQGAINGLMTYLPQWGATLLEFGIKAVSWIADKLPALADNLGQFFNTMVNWVVDSLPGWGENLAALGAKAIGWVLDALPGLGTNLGLMLGNLLGWVAQTVIDVAPKLLELAGKFFSWVGETVIPALPGALETIATALWNFISTTVQTAAPKLVELATKFYSWVQETVIPALPGALEAIKTTIGGWVSGALSWAGGALKGVGRSIVQGLIDGLASMFESVKSKLNELTGMLPEWKGPPARDAKLLYGSGQLVIGGFNQGMLDTIPVVQQTLGDVTDMISDNASLFEQAMQSLQNAVIITPSQVNLSNMEQALAEYQAQFTDLDKQIAAIYASAGNRYGDTSEADYLKAKQQAIHDAMMRLQAGASSGLVNVGQSSYYEQPGTILEDGSLSRGGMVTDMGWRNLSEISSGMPLSGGRGGQTAGDTVYHVTIHVDARGAMNPDELEQRIEKGVKRALKDVAHRAEADIRSRRY